MFYNVYNFSSYENSFQKKYQHVEWMIDNAPITLSMLFTSEKKSCSDYHGLFTAYELIKQTKSN